MLMRTLAGMLIVLAILALGFIFSLPLPCQPEIQTSKTKQEHYTSYKDCASVIGTVFAPIGDFVHAYKDEITALSTFVIAIFTVILGCFTVSVARSTKVAALAAKASADSSIIAERAYVLLGYEEITFDREQHMTIPLVMTNGGRTIGIVKEVGYAFVDKTVLPDSRDAADWKWNTIPYDWASKPDFRKPIRELKSPFAHPHHFVCYVRYQVILTQNAPFLDGYVRRSRQYR